MSSILVFNPKDTPFSRDGIQVGGKEWACIDLTDEVVAHIEAGRLVEVQPPADGQEVNPHAVAAIESYQAKEAERAEQQHAPVKKRRRAKVGDTSPETNQAAEQA